MKKKILYLLLSIIISIIVLIGINVAAKTITLNGTEYDLNDGGNYITQFVKNMTRANFLNIKWDDIKDKYYSASGDKGSTASKTKRIVCINQNTGDGKDFIMKPVAVIDIEGGMLRAEGSMVTKTDEIYLGDKAAAMARAAEYEGSHTNAWVEAFLNYDNAGYDWVSFFNLLREENILSKDAKYDAFTTVHQYYSKNASYRKVLFPGGNVTGYYNIYPEINSEQSKNILITYDSEKNITEIGNYIFKYDEAIHLGDNNVTTQLSIYLEGEQTPIYGELKKVSEKTYKVEVPGKIDKNITSIKFKQSYKGYKAKIILMYTNFSQNRLIMDGESATIEHEIDFEKPQAAIDVSLQKYIIGTVEGDGTSHIQDTSNNGNDLIQSTSGYHEVVTTTESEVEVEDYKEYDNYLMVGDSRTVSIYSALGGTQNDLINDTITVDEKTISFLCKSSVKWNYWLGGDGSSALTNKLDSIKESNKKTKCIFWLGVNQLNDPSIYIARLNTLASSYKNIEFVCYSVGYVGPKYTYVANYNQQIDYFNNVLKNEIQSNKNEKFKKCDFNSDNKVDQTDIDLLDQCARGMSLSTDIKNKIEQYGDLNGDNKITTVDAGMLNLYIKGDIINYSTDNLFYEDFNQKLVIFGQQEINGKVVNVVQLRTIENLIKEKGKVKVENEDGTTTTLEDVDSVTIENDSPKDLHYTADFSEILWKQVFSEGISTTKIEQETVTTTTLEPNTNNNNNNNENNYTPTGRENRYAVSNNADLFDTNNTTYNHKDKEISNHTNRKTVINDYNKSENPVEIEAGDSVVYKIEVYNNRNSETEVTVSDDFPSLGGPVITEIRTSTSGQFNNATVIGDLTKTEYNENNTAYDGVRYWHKDDKNNFKFKIAGGQTRYFYVTIKYTKYTQETLRNIACIPETSPTNETNCRTMDADFVKMKPYAVSLEKFIYKVNDYQMYDYDHNGTVTTEDVGRLNSYVQKKENVSGEVLNNIQKYGDIDGNGEITSADVELLNNSVQHGKEVREGYAEHNYDDKTATNNYWKRNNVVTVSQNDKVTYTIKLTNDGDTDVYITEITDFLPNGIKFENKTYNGTQYSIDSVVTENGVKFNGTRINGNVIIKPKESTSFEVQITVLESNMSLNVLKNTATITEMRNRNNIEVKDTTPNNNTDSDYLKLNYDVNYGIIGGMVWNDTARNKTSDDYNGLFDKEKESKLPRIKVYLYRVGTDGPIASTVTDSNGEYTFSDSDLSSGHIKASTISGTNRWEEYSSLYVAFEYDGITYTSTFDKNGKRIWDISENNIEQNIMYSNACENYDARVNFNKKFETIDKDGAHGDSGNIAIDYDRYIGKTSIEGQEYKIIPQSIHKYDVSKMAMHSATTVITLADNNALIEEVKHINLGLRGRDTLDLNVKTDIDKISLKVNGVTTDYTGKNSITVRKSDLSMVEDAANFASSAITSGNTDEIQDIRQTDLRKSSNFYTDDQLLSSINVTYKITVANESNTGISELSIIDYYDSRYDFKEVAVENCILNKVTEGSNSSDYNSKIITTSGSGTIYVTYELKESVINTLKGLNITEKLPTFNMAEIYEYKSTVGKNQTEYTRGLIDLDSAPGSVASEKVILDDDYNGVSVGEKKPINESTIASRPTTLAYYFNKTDLSKIMYEDDTSVKAVIFNVTDNPRTIKGTVFRDNTILDSNKIRTGNGILDNGEDIVAGATVQLVEYNANISPEEVSKDEGTVIFTQTTDKEGKYSFSGYIPGNYIIRYAYGDSNETVLKNRFDNGKNNYSYNGEDYQSTNNTGSYGSSKLEHNNNFWYITNEQNGISVATDNKTRRGIVSTNVTNSDNLMTLLNNARDGKELSYEEITTVKNDTFMYSTTYMMELKGEKADASGNVPNTFGRYDVENMNFGIAEVPVTTIDLQTSVKQFTIKDAAGDNTIAEVVKQDNGEWEVKTGNVLAPKDTEKIDVSVEEQKLQGAKLQVTYDVTINKNIEKNFDGNSYVNPVITGLVDFVDNNLSYNASLGENNNLWETTTLSEIRTEFAKSQYKDGIVPKGTVVNNDTDYTTILKAKGTNPLLSGTESASCDLVLEKTLSSNDATVENIISSSIEAYDYQNKVEILGINYANNISIDGSITFRDRLRTADRHIILAGSQYDYNESEIITIHPPTGNDNNIIYYVIGIVALGVLTSGIVLIKKFAINKD